jgi:hypothetical protein
MENYQTSLFDFCKTGEQLRDEGMQLSTDSADLKYDKWSDQAYAFLLNYVKGCNVPFQTENIRESSVGFVPEVNGRAWGSIIVKAMKNGVIKRIGYKAVDNPKAHKTPASLFVRTGIYENKNGRN